MSNGRFGAIAVQVDRLFRGGAVASQGEGQLLARFVATRDESAFEGLVDRHGPMVLATCRRMLSDPHDVEDAFQATFLVLARRAGSIRDADRLGPWLHGVARRVASRSRALAARRGAFERPGGEDRAIESADPHESAELRGALDEELGRLPEKYRAPLVLCYLDGLTHDEAARQLRWPVGTVRSRLAGGRDRLRSRLTRRGLSPSAPIPAILPVATPPPTLVTTTARLATASGKPSAAVAALAKGASTMMMMGKLKAIAAVGLMTGLVAGGAGALARQSGDGKAASVGAKPAVTDRIKQLEAELQKVQADAQVIASDRLEVRAQMDGKLQELDKKMQELEVRRARLVEEWEGLLAKQGVPTGDTRKDIATVYRRVEELEKALADRDATIKGLKDREKAAAATTPGGEAGGANPYGSRLGITGTLVATPNRRPAATPLPYGPYVLISPIERDRVAILNSETGAQQTFIAPEGATEIVPIVAGRVMALQIKGSEIAHIAVFDTMGGKWYTQELREPAKGPVTPAMTGEMACYQVGRFLYTFSGQSRKWGVLELKQRPATAPPIPIFSQDGKMIVEDGDVIHVYNTRTGDWTHFGAKDDK